LTEEFNLKENRIDFAIDPYQFDADYNPISVPLDALYFGTA